MKARIIIITTLLSVLLLVLWLGPIVKKKLDFVSTSQEQFNLTTRLSDSWQSVGMFKNNRPLYDTIFRELNDDFDTGESSSYAIWTDSGKYLHLYKGDSLTGVSILNEVDIMEVDLNNGLIKNYQFIPGISEEEILSYNQRVELRNGPGGPYLRIVNNDGSVDSTRIKSLTDSTLVLDWGEGYDERFIRRAK